MRRRSASWLRIIAAIVCLTFSFSTGSWSAAPAATPATLASKPVVQEPSKMEVPSALATLQDSFISTKNSSKKFVIYIQDIHASVNVQEKISDLIQFYSTRYDMNFVAYEGNEGPIDTEKVFWFPDQKLKQAVSKKFLEELKLSGAEYARVNAKTPFQLWGAEDIRLYRRNLKLFQNALRVRQDNLNAIQELEKALIKSFEKAASNEAKRLFHFEEDYTEKRLELLPYIKSLATILEQKSITLSDLPRIGAILEIEKRERQMTDKTQRVSFECEIDQIKCKDFFEELKELEKRARYVSYQQAVEQKITLALDRLEILKAMANLSATRAELDQYWEGEYKFSESKFLSVIRAVSGQKDWRPRYQNFLDDLIQPANDFYVLARKRDHVLASNLLKSLRKQPSAIFVAGGFHTPGVTQQLKKEGISYLILSPKYSGAEKNAEKAYQDSIMKFSENSGKISDFTANTIRQETVLNRESDAARSEVNQKALECEERGVVSLAEYRAVVEDLKQLHARAAKAASLGKNPIEDPVFFRKTLLIPPATPEARTKLAEFKDVDSPWFDRPRHEAQIKTMIDHYNSKYPGMFPENLDSYSYVQVPDCPVVLGEENGRPIIKLDYDLFARSGPALAGLVDVLYGNYLKTYSDGQPYHNLFAVRLFAFMQGLSFLVQTQESQREWLLERLESAGRKKMAVLLKNVWNGSQKFTMNLSDKDSKKTLMDAFGEAWPEGSKWIQKFPKLESYKLSYWFKMVENYLLIKGASERIAAAHRDGNLNLELFAQLADGISELDLLRNVIIYLAKAKKYDTAAAVVTMVIGSGFSGLLKNLCDTMWLGQEDVDLKLEPDELAALFVYFANHGEYDQQLAIESFIRNIPVPIYYLLTVEKTKLLLEEDRVKRGPGKPPNELIQQLGMWAVKTAFNQATEASSLGSRERTVLVQINTPAQAAQFVREAGRFLADTKNTHVVFLVPDRELKSNPEFAHLRGKSENKNRVDVLSNKLISSNDWGKLKDYIENREGDYTLIAPLETLERAASLDGMVKLASDKLQAGNGAPLGFLEADREKVCSALFNTAWQALLAGSASMEFQSRTRQLNHGQIYVMTLEYLNKWLSHLFAEHTYEIQYQSAA